MSAPIRKEPSMPSSTMRKGGKPAFTHMFITRQPPAPPMHITPGMPRFRWPAFSVMISPVEPYMKVAPKPRESTRKSINGLMLCVLS